MDNLTTTIQSQYANSPRLMAIIDSFNESVDPAQVINDFYKKVWNIDTAQGWGLDVWGRIVVIGRVVKIIPEKEYFQWEEAGNSANSWNHAPWYRYVVEETENYYLEDNAFRLLILVKAMANISNGTLAMYNKMLMSIFPKRGNAYVVDNFDMTITLKFKFPLLPYEKAILATSGAFPAPSGQKVIIEDVPYILAPLDSELAKIDTEIALGD